MKEFSIGLLIIFISLLYTPSTSFCDSKSLCPNKIIDRGTITGKYLGWFEAEEGMNYIGIQVPNEKEPAYLVASEEEAQKIFGNNKGQTVKAEYELKQSWEKEFDECFRTIFLKGGQVISNSK